MAIHLDERSASLSAWNEQDGRYLRRIYLASFAVCLVAVALKRAARPWRWRVFAPRAQPRRSIVAEARDVAETSMPVAYFG